MRGYQDRPRESVVAHEQDAAQGQVGQDFAVDGKFLVQFECHARLPRQRLGKPPTHTGLDHAIASLAWVTRT